MSSGTSSPSKIIGQAVLRWSEPDGPFCEIPVQLIEAHASKALIRCEQQLSKKTKVYLMGEKITRFGTVRSCRTDRGAFLLTIASSGDDFTCKPASRLDQGVLAVEDFLTEEQEQQILAALNGEL